jgi:adenylyltransferase/sulfurtransferase
VGAPKAESAARTAQAINPHIRIACHGDKITAANVLDLLADYDIVADGSDNFSTRFLLNDACYFARKTLVSGAVTEFDGQLSTYRAFDRTGAWPCYRCLFAAPPPPGTVPSCSEAGVLGAAAGVMGTLQALEVLKEILDLGQGMAGRLLIYDALDARFRTVAVKPDPACALCGANPSIRDLSGHP